MLVLLCKKCLSKFEPALRHPNTKYCSVKCWNDDHKEYFQQKHKERYIKKKEGMRKQALSWYWNNRQYCLDRMARYRAKKLQCKVIYPDKYKKPSFYQSKYRRKDGMLPPITE